MYTYHFKNVTDKNTTSRRSVNIIYVRFVCFAFRYIDDISQIPVYGDNVICF